jgi:hypothetical protein
MQKQDFVYTDKSGYKIHLVCLAPDKPQRLILIPPLVGATGSLAIRDFRYLLREGCALMSFDYCGHYKGIDNKFTINKTFIDTKLAMNYAYEYSKKFGLPLHVVGICYGAVPLAYIMNELGWPEYVKSMFTVSALVNGILNFEEYNCYLMKRGISFDNVDRFLEFLSSNENSSVSIEHVYISSLTEYLGDMFSELSDIISDTGFGVLEYSRVEVFEAFHEFITIELPDIVIPEHFPCLFFSGVQDQIFNLRSDRSRAKYYEKIRKIAPNARVRNLRIDHFGRGEDRYVIGREAMKFLREHE